MRKLVFSIIIIILSVSQIYCQNELSKFDDFIGKTWIGHYQNSEDSLLVHQINWKYDLQKKVFVETKQVPEIDFICKTFYFQDYEINQISYISFMNKSMISKGTAKFIDGKVELSGYSYFENGIQENKKTFELTDDGKLNDHFFRKSDSKWLQGHFIQYTKKI